MVAAKGPVANAARPEQKSKGWSWPRLVVVDLKPGEPVTFSSGHGGNKAKPTTAASSLKDTANMEGGVKSPSKAPPHISRKSSEMEAANIPLPESRAASTKPSEDNAAADETTMMASPEATGSSAPVGDDVSRAAEGAGEPQGLVEGTTAPSDGGAPAVPAEDESAKVEDQSPSPAEPDSAQKDVPESAPFGSDEKIGKEAEDVLPSSLDSATPDRAIVLPSADTQNVSDTTQRRASSISTEDFPEDTEHSLGPGKQNEVERAVSAQNFDPPIDVNAPSQSSAEAAESKDNKAESVSSTSDEENDEEIRRPSEVALGKRKSVAFVSEEDRPFNASHQRSFPLVRKTTPSVALTGATDDDQSRPGPSRTFHEVEDQDSRRIAAPVDAVALLNELLDNSVTAPVMLPLPEALQGEQPRVKRRSLLLRKARNLALPKPVLQLILGREIADRAKPALQALAHGERLTHVDTTLLSVSVSA